MAKPISLNRNNRFLSAYKRGKSFGSPILITYINKNKMGKNALGITTSKKVGNAVARNRAKRIITAAFRECNKDLLQGYDIVFVARSAITTMKMQDVKAVMKRHLKVLANKDTSI